MLFLIFNFDAGIINSRFIQWHHARVQWGSDAIHAASLRDQNPALSIQVVTPDQLQYSRQWYPFLAASADRATLFFHESEAEDMRLRVGSGQTKILAALSLTPVMLAEWRQAASEYNPSWDPRIVWCLAFSADIITFPVSRSIPANRPIADCWYERVDAVVVEATLVQLHYNWDAPDERNCRNTIIHSFRLGSPGN